MKFTKIICGFIFFEWLMLPALTLAEDIRSISSSLTQHAVYWLDRGKMDQAIEELCQAITLDPDNQTAADQLMAIYDNAPLKPSVQRGLLKLTDDLLHAQRSKKQIEYFNDKIGVMKDLLHRKGFSEKQFESLFEKVIKENEPYWANGPLNKIQLGTNTSAIDAADETLLNLQLHLTKEIQIAKSQFGILKTTYDRTGFSKSESEVRVDVPVVVENLTHESLSGDVALLKKQISSIYQQMAMLSKAIKERDDQITALTNDLVEFTLNVTENEKRITQGSSFFIALNEQISDLKSRLNLSQQIIAERESDIQHLQVKLRDLLNQYENDSTESKKLVVQKTDSLSQCEGIRTIYQKKLMDSETVLKQKTTNMTLLEKQLTIIQKKLDEKNESLRKTKAQLFRAEMNCRALKQRYGIKPQTHSSLDHFCDDVSQLQQELFQIHSSVLQDRSYFETIETILSKVH